MEWYDKFEIIDTHCHIFPQKIAAKASQSIGEFYNINMTYEGSYEGILNSNDVKASKYLVCSSATTYEQVGSINDFLAAVCRENPEFIGFGALHPDMSNIKDEIKRMQEIGIKGIKLHPDFMKFYLDEPKAYKMFEAIGDKMPILIHTGDNRYEYSKPKRMARVLHDIQELTVIGAHFGGYRCWDEVVQVYDGLSNIYFDTSSSLFRLDIDAAKALINHFGIERFFFGTDYPMWTRRGELENLKRLELCDSDYRKLLADNFKAFFKKTCRDELL
ncbi:MAG: amidohydrolase family protein [Oscillospiraceae bacterium]